jgi:hypothetical protein
MADRPSTKLYHLKVVRTKIKHLTPHQGTFSSILNARKLMTTRTNRTESNGIIAPPEGKHLQWVGARHEPGEHRASKHHQPKAEIYTKET